MIEFNITYDIQRSTVCRNYFLRDSLDLTPSVLTHPSVSTSLVSVDGDRLGGSIAVAGGAHPVILILQFKNVSASLRP